MLTFLRCHVNERRVGRELLAAANVVVLILLSTKLLSCGRCMAVVGRCMVLWHTATARRRRRQRFELPVLGRMHPPLNALSPLDELAFDGSRCGVARLKTGL